VQRRRPSFPPTLRTDPEIFDIWAELVTAGERLASFTPVLSAAGEHE